MGILEWLTWSNEDMCNEANAADCERRDSRRTIWINGIVPISHHQLTLELLVLV